MRCVLCGLTNPRAYSVEWAVTFREGEFVEGEFVGALKPYDEEVRLVVCTTCWRKEQSSMSARLLAEAEACVRMRRAITWTMQRTS